MAAMSEWQDLNDTHVWEEQKGQPADSFDDNNVLEFGESDEFANDGDDFGGFGDNDNNSAADFDDFGDFNEFGISDAPELLTVLVVNKHIEESVPVSDVDRVLAKAKSLIDSSTDSYDNRAAILDECLDQALGSTQQQLHGEHIESNAHSNIGGAEEAEDMLERLIGSGLPLNVINIPASEPRLLRNLVLIAAATKLPEELHSQLLMPVAQTESATNQTRKQAPAAIPMLDIDRIRQLELQSTSSEESLRHALKSINALISAKEKEIAKRKDSIEAYNQVIQTLVAQATKLH
ncbi:hypothetical protein LPJ66_001539 [Kickxella alabastrina]|uniref:Uncharacterized protein n=1 Tax=Kickxella alabastrina TaxID=61397 RepID=A0ACC1IT13_9FUNG|nr:hypothetical protein LPJ66_001539 [Kickxella alabastrina]